ncbi:LacI family DNA-binding transcriptional regulator [Planctomicrobium sp. SH661]|uniref:LacI family DNA-binding transcriptional regulator n=1 Tax=Planctomicrobium sp. SH661 TaxID=3448124 RepID=UPI003F5B656D
MMAIESQKVRLVDIARKAGVSRAAVGHVLNHSGINNVRVSPETRERVLKIAQEMNYRPNRAAQQLRGKPTHMLGVILNTVNTAVFSARLSAIEIEAQRRGYRMVIGQVHGDPGEIQGYLDDFADRGIDGVLCLFDVMQDTRTALQPVFKGRPGMVLHAAPILKSQAFVRVDTASAIRQLVDHLVSRGRQRIGLELCNQTDQLMTVRHEAWKAALQAHKLPASPKMMWMSPENTQQPTRETVDECVQYLVFDQKVDAIIASNDQWAARIIQGLRRRNLKVPQDVAITGYDNLELGEIIEPTLTTIDQSHTAYAVAALDLMEESLKNRRATTGEQRVVEPRLIIREST